MIFGVSPGSISIEIAQCKLVNGRDVVALQFTLRFVLTIQPTSYTTRQFAAKRYLNG